MPITQANTGIMTGSGLLTPERAEFNSADGSIAFHSVPEIGGAAVTNANPMPVAVVSGGGGGGGAVTSAALDPSAGSVAGGTAGTASLLTGAVFRTALPTLTNGQQVALQVDANGRLLTTSTGSSTFGTTGPGAAPSQMQLNGGKYTSAGVTLTDGQSVAFQTTVQGAVQVQAGGYTGASQVTPTVQAAAYAVGNVIGGLLTLTGAARAVGSGLIQQVMATFVSGVVPSLDIIFFNASPTGSTVTDKTALAVATADLGKVVGVVHASDGTLLGATLPSIVQATQQALAFNLPSGTSLFAAVVTRTAITLTSTADMILTTRILQD